MREEDYIRRKCGSDNHFNVPEGYFEQFGTHLMQQISEQEKKNSSRTTPLWRSIVQYSAAAVACGALFVSALSYFSSQTEETVAQQTAPIEDSYYWEDSYSEDALDYAMVSNHEIVQYLSEAY